MAERQDIGNDRRYPFFRGEDKTLRATIGHWVTVGSQRTFVADDISGWTFTFTVRGKADDPDPALIEKTSGAGITLYDAPNGLVDVAILDTDTVDLDVGRYDYDLKRMDDGSETVVVYGTLTLSQEVTR